MGITGTESFGSRSGGYVAILGALRRELKHIRSEIGLKRRISDKRFCLWVGSHGPHGIILVQTGVGPERAQKAVKAAISLFPVKALISVGFASALQNEMRIGDLVIGEHAFFYDAPLSHRARELFSADGHLLLLAEQVLQDSSKGIGGDGGFLSGPAFFKGPILTVRRIIENAVEKRTLASATGAIALDMESAAIGGVAAEAKIAYLPVRAISDLINENLEFLTHFLSPTGTLRPYRGIHYLLSHPTAFTHLNRLRLQTAVASKRLSDFVRNYLHRLN